MEGVLTKILGRATLTYYENEFFFLIPLSTTFWNPKILGFLFVYEK